MALHSQAVSVLWLEHVKSPDVLSEQSRCHVEVVSTQNSTHSQAFGTLLCSSVIVEYFIGAYWGWQAGVFTINRYTGLCTPTSGSLRKAELYSTLHTAIVQYENYSSSLWVANC